MSQPFHIRETADGIVFKIFVQPKSSRNMIAGAHGDALKVKLTAPPVDNAANKLCVKYLAKCLKVPKSALEIVSGHTSRTKQLLLRNPDGPPDRAAITLLKKKVTGMLNLQKTG